MNGLAIADVFAWEALDSRGRPTVACEVRLNTGIAGEATVPSGASTGRHEARELRDGGPRHRGLGAGAAVRHVLGEIRSAIIGRDPTDQAGLDATLRSLDGTEDLGRLGANAILAVSVAAAVAGARGRGLPLYAAVADSEASPLLPLPMVNVISGGAHAGRAIDVQDFLVVPLAAGSFAEGIEWAGRVRAGTAEVLAERGGYPALVADEGGLAAHLPSNQAALDLLLAGIERAGLTAGDEVGIAVDVAASQLHRADGGYELAAEGRIMTPAEWVDELARWCARYPIVSVEDPLDEDDWDAWRHASERLAGRQLLGDDLFATQPHRVEHGIREGVANAVLVKPNQAGTLDTARRVVRQAKTAGYATVLSARSGETEDSWLADLAVGWRTGQIKVGSTTRSERTAKWNRLLRIEAELGDRAEYAGRTALDATLVVRR